MRVKSFLGRISTRYRLFGREAAAIDGKTMDRRQANARTVSDRDRTKLFPLPLINRKSKFTKSFSARKAQKITSNLLTHMSGTWFINYGSKPASLRKVAEFSHFCRKLCFSAGGDNNI